MTTSPTDTDDTTAEPDLASAFSDTGRALTGDESEKLVDKSDVPPEHREWVAELTDALESIEQRVARREEKRARRRQAAEDLVARVEALDEKLTDLEKDL